LLERAAKENLPAISWTVASAGCGLVGRGESFPMGQPSRAPALIGDGQDLRLTRITAGSPDLTWRSPLVGVRIREQGTEARNGGSVR